jgi:hypothetical protein
VRKIRDPNTVAFGGTRCSIALTVTSTIAGCGLSEKSASADSAESRRAETSAPGDTRS